MIHIRTAEEIELLHQAAQVVSRTLGILAKEVKPGVFKCQNPGICPGQAEKALNLYKNGATDILIGHCTDCSNTVAANVAKIPVEMHHATDHAKDSMGLERTRAMK